MKVNSERIGENVEKNPILVTLLNQYIYWIFEGRRDIRGINKFKEIDQGVSS
ncbi:MAG TPA: hypothetical protein VJ729_18065 [Nitrososphaeraceae archaeon]|nr:hypothetical protein [Nitrososphaeraceae archaeon]